MTMNDRLSCRLAALACAALLVPVALSFAGSKEKSDPVASLRSGIKEVVADPDRAAKMLAAVDEIEAAIGELNSLIADERASLRALLLDHGSSRAAVDASLAEFNANHESLARRCLTAHAALKAEATAAEWKKLRKLELEVMTFAASRSLGQAAPAGKEG
jgi:hypothetical protein